MNTKSAKVKAVNLKPGSKLIVEIKQPLPPKQLAAIKRTVENWAGPDHPVILTVTSILEIREE